jgi:hypothetical protein
MPDSAGRNLILAFCTNADPARVRTFLATAREVHPPEECDIVLGVNQPEVVALAGEFHGVYPIPVVNTYSRNRTAADRALKRLLLWQCGAANWVARRWAPTFRTYSTVGLEFAQHPHTGRWFFYRRVLDVYRGYRAILISDAADVAFQTPFFQDVGAGEIVVAEDTGMYGRGGFNDQMMTSLHGRGAVAKLSGTVPVCAGAILGGAGAMSGLVDRMMREIAIAPNASSDQARLNYVVHVDPGGLTFRVTPNAGGPITHLCGPSIFEDAATAVVAFEDERIRRRRDGAIVPIVHMYNRMPAVMQSLSARFGGAAPAPPAPVCAEAVEG